MLRIRYVRSSGKFEKNLERLIRGDQFSNLERFGRAGVNALRSVTPVNTGLTGNSWDYEVIRERDKVTIQWTNSNDAAGTPIVLLIQYGHGTGTGGYVPGRDFINPAVRPIFDNILNDVWKQVING